MWKIIGCNLNFCFDTNKYYCNNAVNIMVGNKTQLLQFLALMNSKLFNWYLKNTTSAEVQGGGIQMYSTVLELLFLKLDFRDNNIISLCYKITKNKSLNLDTQDLEIQLNNLIYKLYNITDEEINIINCK